MCGPDKTNKKVILKKGESFSYRTQAGEMYEGRVKCKVKYRVSNPTIFNIKGLTYKYFQRNKKCKNVNFSCSSFDVKNKNENCTRGDKMVVNGVK